VTRLPGGNALGKSSETILLAEYLLSMTEAFQRFMPGVRNIAARTGLSDAQLGGSRAGVIDGDLTVTMEGLVYTNQMVPAFADAQLGALFVLGSLIAPMATLAEPDIDWSPLLKVKGNLVAKNLCLGGSASEIDGDVKIEGVLMGYYNHGEMRIGGRTHAHLIIIDDYRMTFGGPVERKYAVSGGAARTNIAIDYDRDRLDLILVPEVMDETNFLHDGVVLDRLKRGLPILRPEDEIGTPPPRRLSDKGAARLAELRARKERGETIEKVNFEECELRFVPDDLQEFSAARELVLSKNAVKAVPAWIGAFEGLEVLKLEDCALRTIPREIAQLPRLRRLELIDNPLTSLPFGPDSFRAVEILRIGEGTFNSSADFTANLDLAQFPWLRVIEQRYDVNTVEELVYREDQELWTNPHLEILDIGWPALRNGIPQGLLRARSLKALATRVNAAQLGSVMVRMQKFEHFEYLSIGYSDLTREQLARLYDALPRAFISSQQVGGKSEYEYVASQKLFAIESELANRRFAEPIAALDEMTASLDLRRPLLPANLHAQVMMLAVKARRVAAQEEQDRSPREAMAEAALTWAERVMSVLPANPESCWYLDYHKFWLVRLQCLYARATGFALRAVPDTAAANAALDLAQAELDRFLLPINTIWHANESAVVERLRARIPT
jgi:hypothetical protein